jgi:4-amino-4-deoxy-L-arabinose transferase-like glycosyltransferase
LYALGNQIIPLIDRDEPRFAEASREMLESGDWIIPRFNGVERFDKPPLIYWMQATAYRTFGETEFAARLPTVLCGALLAGLLVLWTARWQGEAVAWKAGWIFVLCFQMLQHGRAAVADMPMILCLFASAWAGWEALRPALRPRWGLWLLFWALMGVGFLAKGPLALIPLGMIAGPMLRGQTRRYSVEAWLAGIAILLLIVGAWGIPALVQTDGRYAQIGLGKHVIERTAWAMEGHGSKTVWGYVLTAPYYFLSIFISFFPWSLRLPGFVGDLRRGMTLDPLGRYLLTGVVLVFVIFTLSRTKLLHYTLPTFPFLAMLLANWWQLRRSEAAFRLFRNIGLGIAIGIPLLLGPMMRAYFPSELVAEKISQVLTPTTTVGAVQYHEPSLVWQMRKVVDAPVQLLEHSKNPGKLRERLDTFMSGGGQRVLVIPEASFKEVYETVPNGWRLETVEGYQIARGVAKTRLAIAIKPTTEPAPEERQPDSQSP